MAIRRPETVKRAGARSTRSSSRLRLHPVPVARSRTAHLPAKCREGQIGEDQQELVEVVEEGYRRFSAVHLSAMTHKSGSPWDITVKEKGLGAVISTSLIQKHYSSKLPGK